MDKGLFCLHTELAPLPPLSCVWIRLTSAGLLVAMPIYFLPPLRFAWYVYAGLLGVLRTLNDDRNECELERGALPRRLMASVVECAIPRGEIFLRASLSSESEKNVSLGKWQS